MLLFKDFVDRLVLHVRLESHWLLFTLLLLFASDHIDDAFVDENILINFSGAFALLKKRHLFPHFGLVSHDFHVVELAFDIGVDLRFVVDVGFGV